MSLSLADLVCTWDDDDIYTEDRVRLQVEFLLEHPRCKCASRLSFVFSDFRSQLKGLFVFTAALYIQLLGWRPSLLGWRPSLLGNIRRIRWSPPEAMMERRYFFWSSYGVLRSCASLGSFGVAPFLEVQRSVLDAYKVLLFVARGSIVQDPRWVE